MEMLETLKIMRGGEGRAIDWENEKEEENFRRKRERVFYSLVFYMRSDEQRNEDDGIWIEYLFKFLFFFSFFSFFFLGTFWGLWNCDSQKEGQSWSGIRDMIGHLVVWARAWNLLSLVWRWVAIGPNQTAIRPYHHSKISNSSSPTMYNGIIILLHHEGAKNVVQQILLYFFAPPCIIESWFRCASWFIENNDFVMQGD